MATCSSVGLGYPEALLKAGEGRLVAVVGHDLAVEQQTLRPLSRHGPTHLGVGGGQILAVTDSSRTSPPVYAPHTFTVELALQEPVIAEIPTIGQRRQHERDRHKRTW